MSGDQILVGVRFSAPVPLRPIRPPIQWVQGLSRGVKLLGRGVDRPSPYRTEVKKRVQPYLYSLSGPSWPVLGWTLPFTIGLTWRGVQMPLQYFFCPRTCFCGYWVEEGWLFGWCKDEKMKNQCFMGCKVLITLPHVISQVMHMGYFFLLIWVCWIVMVLKSSGDRGGTMVKVLCYKSEGRWFDSRWCHWNLSLT